MTINEAAQKLERSPDEVRRALAEHELVEPLTQDDVDFLGIWVFYGPYSGVPVYRIEDGHAVEKGRIP